MHLVELGQGLLAFIHPESGYGYSNVGLVIDGDGATVIDTGATPAQATEIRAQIVEMLEPLGLVIKRVIVTSSRVPFSGGSRAFPAAGIYGSEPTSDQLDDPVNPLALRRLLPQFAADYGFDFTTRPVTHTVTESAWLTPAIQAVVGPGESPLNLIAIAPGASVAYLGALGSFGVTPLAFDGDPARWVHTLAEISTYAATIVPGHGPVGGRGDLETLMAYFQAVVAAGGDVDRLATGPWEDWRNREFDAVNVERAARLARGDYAIPNAMYELLGMT